MNKKFVIPITLLASSAFLMLNKHSAFAGEGYMTMGSGDNKFTATVKLESNPEHAVGISAVPDQSFISDAQFGLPAANANDSKALINVIALNPKNDTDTYRNFVTLEIQGLGASPAYTPSGKGFIHTYWNWPLDNKWIYGAFTEPKSAHYAELKVASIIAKYDGVRISRPLRVSVWPVFTFLARQHQHGPSETDTPKSPHAPTDADYDLAWHYAQWKYGINISNISVHVKRALTTKGYTYITPITQVSPTRDTQIGLSAFSSERVCAGTLGHENVHGSEAMGLSLEESEKAAYGWELLHSDILYYTDSEKEDALSWYNYYNGTGPNPNGENG